jgi:DNA-binding CsgD family transcriptional regulator
VARLDAVLEPALSSTRAVVIEGDAGVGKTTLWREALTRAAARGCTVVSCKPAEAEAWLSFQGLSDLLGPVLGTTFDALPLPQRRALDVALHGGGEGERPIDHRTVAAATLGVLELLSDNGPLVVAVDDLQWLDGPSGRALGFAIRRLADRPVVVIATRRAGAADSGIADALRELPNERLEVGPLSLGAIQKILLDRLGVQLPRATLTRIHRASGGNPLFALQLADAMAPLDHVLAPDEPLPVPRDLKALLLDRIRRLPKIAGAVLLVIAVVAGPADDILGQLDENGWTDAVDRARRAGVLVASREGLQFTHPLFASAVEATATPAELRMVHRKLAAVVADEEARARHLALSTDEPDANVADSLEAAASRTNGRGAPDAAAELVELARRVTPPGAADDLRRRDVALADYSFAAGDTARALAVLQELVAASDAGLERADLLRRLAKVHSHRDSLPAAIQAAEQGLVEAEGDPALTLAIERELLFPLNVTGDISGSGAHAARVIELSEELGDEAGLAQGLGVAALCDFMLGRGVDRAAVARVLALDPAVGGPALLDARGLLSHVLAWTGDVAAARESLDVLRQRLVDDGDEASLANILFRGAMIEIPGGDWSLAERWVQQGEDICRRTGQDAFLSGILSVRSSIHTFRGEFDAAKACAEQGIASGAATGAMLGIAFNIAALGFLASSRGDAAGTHEHLGPLVETMRGAGVDEPASMWWLADEIEAVVALGHEERAAELIDWLDLRSRAIDRPTGLAVAARCRGLARAADGDIAGTAPHFEEALRQHDRQRADYELGRTLLAKGRVERRGRKWGQARDSLERARSLFEPLGAVVWANRAGEELGRIGGRTASADLSETERRVAELVVSGMSNREVADALFMSPRTVQSNLSRVFQKLGVRSRGELAARAASGGV